MITNKGKDIIAKYLIGQAPGYASHIALGCGSKPLDYNDLPADYSNKKTLDFEMVRTPIISRGYVTDIIDVGGIPTEVSKVVFTAEVPTELRYSISEVGIFSSGSNPSAIGRDSRVVYTFTEAESWQYHTKNEVLGLGNVVSEPAYVSSSNNTINTTAYGTGAFRISNNNALFDSEVRTLRFEQPRFLGSSILVPGNMSELQYNSDNKLEVKPSFGELYYGTHIHLNDINIDLNRNSPSDKLTLAFSVINKAATYTGLPAGARILIEFSSDDSSTPTTYAKFEADVSGSDLTQNRYRFVTKSISELEKSPSFSWNDIKLVKIYATVLETISSVTAPSSNFYIALDGFRLENISSENPLYGMSGYSVIRTNNGQPVIKDANTSNLVEFRFGLDVI